MSEKLSYRDEAWLREKYEDEGMWMSDIADLCGCSISTVSRWMDRFGIEKRPQGMSIRKPGVTLEMGSAGRMKWHGTYGRDGEKIDYSFYAHRLLAIAEYGVDAVTPDVDAHHKNGIPWDNRPDNIELLPRDEHGELHSRQWHDEIKPQRGHLEVVARVHDRDGGDGRGGEE